MLNPEHDSIQTVQAQSARGPNRRAKRKPSGQKQWRLGRLQRLVLTGLAHAGADDRPMQLAELSRMIAEVRGHTERADRKKVHKNTFYRAVQGLCDKGYVRRGANQRGLRLLAKGLQIIEDRELSWEDEKRTAESNEQKLLDRQVEWQKIGKKIGGKR